MTEDLVGFGERILDATASRVCCCKPNAAFYEARGAQGWEALGRTIEYAHAAGLPVILDVKRADVGSTAEAHAHAAFRHLGADAVTVNPYLGEDGVRPFVVPGRGVFVLCRTSNPTSGELQALDCGGEPLYRFVARCASRWLSGGVVGLVVGATYPDVVAEIRGMLPNAWFLLPGLGAQGGSLAAVERGVDGDGVGVVASVSRAIIADTNPAARAEALRLALNRARGRG
jgi:orotidine 5'-phosphate decarboxylase subfamily 2